jgi:hypothetical protein
VSFLSLLEYSLIVHRPTSRQLIIFTPKLVFLQYTLF